MALGENNPWLIAARKFAVLEEDQHGDALSGWIPQPKQRLAEQLARTADELLYGGAAYSGKTLWGLHHVIAECEKHYRNRALVLRRVWPSLRRDVLPRIQELLAGRATYKAGDKTFVFPNGSTLELGHMVNADSLNKYQGGSYGVVFFEELTEFLDTQFEGIRPWVRVPPGGDPDIHPHVIATTNPGGIGHRWVKQRFVRSIQGKAYPLGEVWEVTNPESEDVTTRAYIPATSQDNPAGVSADPGYIRRLRGNISNRGLRQAMEHGDWDAIDLIAGALWQYDWLDASRVEEGYLDKMKATRRAVACDPSEGGEAGNEFGLWAGGKASTGEIITTHSMPILGSVKSMARTAITLYHDTRADVMFIEKNHGGKWLEAVFKDLDPHINIEMVWASEGKITRAEPVAAQFEPDPEHPGGLMYRARLEGYHVELEQELCTYSGGAGEASPNILDALVWGHKGLMEPSAIINIHKEPGRRVMAGAPGRMRV